MGPSDISFILNQVAEAIEVSNKLSGDLLRPIREEYEDIMEDIAEKIYTRLTGRKILSSKLVGK